MYHNTKWRSQRSWKLKKEIREDHLRPGVGDQPGQHGETPSLLKNTQISQAWWQALVIPATPEAEAGRITCTQEVEVRESQDSTIRFHKWCLCTTAWATEWDSVSNISK